MAVEPEVGVAEPDLITERGIRLPSAALSWLATRSGGPGGQHANTSDSRVVYELDLDAADLPAATDAALRAAHGPVVRVIAADSRSQFRNRTIARARLAALVDDAARPITPRRPTRPSRSASRRRLDDKSQQAAKKRDRSWRPDGEP